MIRNQETEKQTETSLTNGVGKLPGKLIQLNIKHFKTTLKQIKQVSYDSLRLVSSKRLIHKLTNQTRSENKVNLMRFEIYLQSLIIVFRSWQLMKKMQHVVQTLKIL